MNILIISQSLTGGGAEKLAANLSLELAKNNNVSIITYQKDIQEYKYAGERINIALPGGRGGFLRHILVAFKRIRKIKTLKEKLSIDFSISFVPQTDYANILSRINKEKIILDIVSNMSFVYPTGLKHFFRKCILKSADYIVTVSEGVRVDLIDNFGIEPKNVKTIYNSCDIMAIERDCQNSLEYLRLKKQLPEKYICSMGSFRHPKGHWHLLKAFANIKDTIPEYKLVILGDGQYRENYEEIIRKYSMQDRVILPGFANPPFSIIAKSDLFVFSSVFEGLGHSIIEAMACGTPVISSDCDYGPREILAPGTDIRRKATDIEIAEYGVLLPPFNMDDIDCESNIDELEKLMGDAMVKVLHDDKLMNQYRDKGRKYAMEFDNSVYGKRWIELMRSIK